jgi:hypothetical protein
LAKKYKSPAQILLTISFLSNDGKKCRVVGFFLGDEFFGEESNFMGAVFQRKTLNCGILGKQLGK